MAHTLIQRGDYARILRVSDGGTSFSGNAVNMRATFRRLKNSEQAISDLVERRMKTYRDGAPWEKYQRWLAERKDTKVRQKVEELLIA